MNDCDFGRRLAYFRLTRGLTQAGLAEQTGLSARCISDLERGINAAPRLSTLHMLADALDLDAGEKRELLAVATCARLEVRFGAPDVPRPPWRSRRTLAAS